MNKRTNLVFRVILLTLCAIFIGFTNKALAQNGIIEHVQQTAETWLDNFDSSQLNESWSWVREDPGLWSLTANPGKMRLITHDGHLWQNMNNMKNLLLQPAPTNNFLIETLVEIEPDSNFQGAGLLIYYDDDNTLSLKRAYCDLQEPLCVGNGIYFDKEEDGESKGGNFPTTTIAHDVAYLRIVKDINTYTGYYSENGIDWIQIGTHQLNPLPDSLKIGLFAGQNNAPTTPELPADFDYFKLVTSTFSDVLPTHWAFQFINAIYNSGLTSGYPDGTYRPENQVTRAEMAVFLLGGMGISSPAIDGSHPFSDISGHWAEAYIEELYDQGITGGYPDGTYRPENQVTRAEMAIFLLKGIGVTPPPLDGSHPFSDIAGHWAEIFIEELYDQGITGGYPDGTYRPQNQVTRAEMAVFLVKTFNLTVP